MKQTLILLSRLRNVTLLRYLVASALSLSVDIGSFTLLLMIGAGAPPAAAAGYALGIVAHWLISSRKVFAGSVALQGPARTRQKALFVVSALIGLGITTLIVSGAGIVNVDPHLAKLVAVLVSFSITWLLREKVIFGQKNRGVRVTARLQIPPYVVNLIDQHRR